MKRNTFPTTKGYKVAMKELTAAETLRTLLNELLEVRAECKEDGVTWCRFESALAKALRASRVGFVCPECDYPAKEKPEKLCERCSSEIVAKGEADEE